MKIVWLIQSSGFSTNNIVKLQQALDKLGYEYKDFGLIPFTNQVTNLENILEPNIKYIIKGGTKLLTLLGNVDNISELCPHLTQEQIDNSDYYINALREGIDYNVAQFDQLSYSNKRLPLLNLRAHYYSYDAIFNTSFDENMFIKPSKDLKAFTGGILEAGVTIEDYIQGVQHQSFYKDETIIIAPLVKIYSEYRFFVVDGEVISGSLYNRGGQPTVSADIPDYIMEKAIEYATLYQPADIFVMDLCEVDEGIKIVEYNCWNASGFYSCDVQKICSSIQNFKL